MNKSLEVGNVSQDQADFRRPTNGFVVRCSNNGERQKASNKRTWRCRLVVGVEQAGEVVIRHQTSISTEHMTVVDDSASVVQLDHVSRAETVIKGCAVPVGGVRR